MQNPNTGQLKELTSEQFEKIQRSLESGQPTGLTFKDGTPVPANVALFQEGQLVDVVANGIKGKFRIRKITKKDLILRSTK